MKTPTLDLRRAVPPKELLVVALAVSLGAVLGCYSADARAAVEAWVEATSRGDITAARAIYDPQKWPDGYVIWERDFAQAIADSAQVSYESQATFTTERAQILVRTHTEDMRIAWIFKLRQTTDGEWVIISILRYFE